MTRAVAKDGRETTFNYDANGRMTRYQDIHGFVLQYGYDAIGNRTSLIYPGSKTVNYEYDTLSRLVAVIDWLGNRTEYSYGNTGNLTRIDYPNGTYASIDYDPWNRPIAYQNFGIPGQELPRFAYKLDSLGNKIAETRKGIQRCRNYNTNRFDQL